MTEAELAAYRRRNNQVAPVEVAQVVAIPGKAPSELEVRFGHQLIAGGFHEIPRGGIQHGEHLIYERGFLREFKPISGRDFELDFALPFYRVGVEIQGMVHRIKSKWKADNEKRILCMLNGWRVVELDGDLVRSEQGFEYFKRVWTMVRRDRAIEATPERLSKRGWVSYPIAPDLVGNFVEDLDLIRSLVGSDLYEWKGDGGDGKVRFYVRRVVD